MSASNLSQLEGIPFTKMTGSGNDFVFFDGRRVAFDVVTAPDAIAAICHRNNGIGADGIVVLEPRTDGANARIHYFNSDGSPADLCGNATLCSTTLSVALGLAESSNVGLETPAGLIRARICAGAPEIDLAEAAATPLAELLVLEDTEIAIGFVTAGIPHLVVLCGDADAVDLVRRGRELRWHPATGPKGANVNWVSARPDGSWRFRTYERGVEGETLACGTGAIAAAVQLVDWGHSVSPVRLLTSSGRILEVELRRTDSGGWSPTLRGEGRIVFHGRIGTLG